MARNRRWMICWAVAAVTPSMVLAGCPTRHASPPLSAQAKQAGSEPRPPGIALDPAFTLPSARTEADTDRGLVVLSTPGDTRLVHALLRRFFQAVAREDSAQLGALLKEQATVVLDKNGKRVPALAWWQQRFTRLDYRTTEETAVYDQHQIETYRPEDLARAGRVHLAQVPGAGAELIVRVPVTLPRLGRVRLWGDEIWFVLGAGPGGYQILEMQEYLDLS